MSGWYGHVVSVNIQNNIKFPKYTGKLSLINPFITEEVNRLDKKVKFLGSEISYNVALQSQIAQRNAITELEAVDTGRLRHSVKITGSGLTSYIGTDLYYAQTVHDEGFRGNGGINVKWPNGVGPRPWTVVSTEVVVRSIDSIVESSLNKIF